MKNVEKKLVVAHVKMKQFSPLASENKNKSEKKSLEGSPWDQSGLLSKYFLFFILPFMKKGLKGLLKLENIPLAPKLDRTKILGKKLENNYNSRASQSKRGSYFSNALWITFRWDLLLVCVAEICAKCIAAPMQSVALGWMIRDAAYYSSLKRNEQGYDISTKDNQELYSAYIQIIYDTIILIVATFSACMLSHPFFTRASHVGMKMRVASSYMIYKKSLNLSQAALSQTTLGQMVNLLSNDVSRLDEIGQKLPYLIIAPVQAAVILILLATTYIGLYPSLACLVTILVYVIIQTSMGKCFNALREKIAKRTDERVRLLDEIIGAICIIKLYAWELAFKRMVELARKREMTAIALDAILKVINQALFFVSFDVILSTALITFVLLGSKLTTEVVFVTMGLSNLMSISLTMLFPDAIAKAAETFVSCKRIDRFIQLASSKDSTLKSNEIHEEYTSDCDTKHIIILEKVWCYWTRPSDNIGASKGAERCAELEKAVVRDLSISLSAHDLCIIVGRVGSGKSSVLSAMLGELPIISGRLKMNGQVSYASQSGWIFSGSVKDNILLGRDFDQARYIEVVRVCSLQRDLKILANGDATVVGEQGASLSGGQQARVNLARALYAQADIYLLDDPLSALDGPVAQHIFKEAIQTFLRNKAVIIATHQLQFLCFASMVLVVDRDLPAAFGTLQEVTNSDAFKALDYGKKSFESANRSKTDSSKTPKSNSNSDFAALSHISIYPNLISKESLSSDSEVPKKQKEADEKVSSKLRETNTECSDAIPIRLGTYFYYIGKCGGFVMAFISLALIIFSLVCVRFLEYFLSYWSNLENAYPDQGELSHTVNPIFDSATDREIVLMYSGLVIACMLSNLLRAAVLFSGSCIASMRIHRCLLNSIIHAPMSFFHFSPKGILLNKFSRDIGFVDEILPETIIDTTLVLGDAFANVIVILLINYIHLPAILLFLLIGVLLHSIATPTITKLKQLEGIMRSPIYSHLSTTISGLSVIRSSSVQEKFILDFEAYQDAHSGVWFSYICSCRWLSISLDLLCSAFVGSVLIVEITLSNELTDVSMFALLLAQTIMIQSPFQYGLRQLIECESQMTSVERLRKSTELESEPTSSNDSRKLGQDSEQLRHHKDTVLSNHVSFEEVTLRYFPDEPAVLKNLNFSIALHEKIGIVGRTGAGKSSIISVLFRLYNFEGAVKLNGCDTKDLSLVKLRSSISVIPQEPVLFAGTIRKNLDPLEKYPDDQLWEALESVQLKPFFARHPAKLEFIIHEGGSNFSVGQRQLICLARAIVRRNKILVLDEATANVDPETDEFIQKTIGQQFANCTVITIAHRLITIAASDKVLVLDHGEVKEFASPYELLQDEKSLFSQMVANSTGQEELIKNKVEVEYERKRNQDFHSCSTSD